MNSWGLNLDKNGNHRKNTVKQDENLCHLVVARLMEAGLLKYS